MPLIHRVVTCQPETPAQAVAPGADGACNSGERPPQHYRGRPTDQVSHVQHLPTSSTSATVPDRNDSLTPAIAVPQSRRAHRGPSHRLPEWTKSRLGYRLRLSSTLVRLADSAACFSSARAVGSFGARRSTCCQAATASSMRSSGVQTPGVQTPGSSEEFRHPRSPEFRHPRSPGSSGGVQTPAIPREFRSSDTRDPPGVQTPAIPRGVQTPAIPREFRHPRSPAEFREFRHPRSPRSPDPGEAGCLKLASPMWSFSIGCLTRHVDWILLISTVSVDMISVMNARRCFRSVTDAHIRPAPDRR
jgi:hypothetical protein